MWRHSLPSRIRSCASQRTAVACILVGGVPPSVGALYYTSRSLMPSNSDVGCGRHFQFGKLNFGRTACDGYRTAPQPQDRKRLLWRTSTVGRRLICGGCTLEAVLGGGTFRPIG